MGQKISNCFSCLFFFLASAALVFCNKNMSTVIFSVHHKNFLLCCHGNIFWLRDVTDTSFHLVIVLNVVTMAMHRMLSFFFFFFWWYEGKSFIHLFLLQNTTAVLTTTRMLQLKKIPNFSSCHKKWVLDMALHHQKWKVILEDGIPLQKANLHEKKLHILISYVGHV